MFMLTSSHSSNQSALQEFPFLKNLPLFQIITRGRANEKYQENLRRYHDATNRCIPIILQKHPIDTEMYFIVAGEQSYFFAKNEGFSNIPTYIISTIDQDLSFLLQILPKIHLYLHCLEQAYIYHFLLSSPSFTQEELSELIPIGRSTISRILKLTRLPHIIQQDLFQNQLRVSLAKEFSTISDFSLCMKLYAQHQKNTFTVAQLREEIKKHEIILQQQKRPTQVYSLQDLQNLCSHFFQQDCRITQNINQCSLNIQFNSLIELQKWIQQRQENCKKR
jgi:ParB/RepB/Spo0J family partition protein